MDAVSALHDYNKLKTMKKEDAVAEGLYISIGQEIELKLRLLEVLLFPLTD